MKKIFLSSSSLKNLTYKECLEEFKNLKIKNVELSYNKYDKFQNKEILKTLKNYNFQIHNYFPNDSKPFFLNLSSVEKTIVTRSINKICNNIKRAKLFNTSYVSFHAGFLFDIKKKRIVNIYRDYNKAMDVFKKNVEYLSKIAEKYKIMLLIENNVLTKKNLDFFKFNPLLLTHPKEIESFFKWAPKNVRLIFDTGHFNINAKTLKFDKYLGIKKVIKYTEAFQLSENNSIQDENKPISLDSWFMPFLKKKKFSFFSLELDENYKNEFKKQMILLKDYLKK